MQAAYSVVNKNITEQKIINNIVQCTYTHNTPISMPAKSTNTMLSKDGTS